MSVISLFKKRSIIAVDISPMALRAVQLRCDTLPMLEACAQSALPSLEGARIQDLETLSNTLKLLLAQPGFTAREVWMAMPDVAVIHKVIPLSDTLKNTEIETWVRQEADKHIPYALHDLYFDYQVLDTLAKRELLLVASRSEYVQQRIEMVLAAQRELRVMDVECYAIERMLRHLLQVFPPAENDALCFIFHVDKLVLQVYGLQNTVLIFSRQESLLSDETEPMLAALHTALQDFWATNKALPIGLVCLLGDGVKMQEVAERLTIEYGVSCHLIDLFQLFSGRSAKKSPPNFGAEQGRGAAYFRSLGLALRGLA
ncbi:MAG: pilus assembly protein PilM [Legionellaceae bacterium]|nr:pilus assembly protein PilM [Legionellaceae bacterium]